MFRPYMTYYNLFLSDNNHPIWGKLSQNIIGEGIEKDLVLI